MTAYRRNFVPGGSFFFTVNLSDRRSRVLTEHDDLLQQAFRYVRARHPFTIDAMVVLPDHLHAIWTLPSGDADYATRWRLIKGFFSRGIEGGEPISASRERKGERGIWQRRYWEHTLRDERDFERHCDYIHFNPVKHGHVTSAGGWPYSSFRRFVDLGSTRRIGQMAESATGVISENDDGGYAQPAMGIGAERLHPSYKGSESKAIPSIMLKRWASAQTRTHHPTDSHSL